MTEGPPAEAPRGGAGEVRIVPLGREHLARTLEWARDPGIARDLGLRRPASAEATEAWFARADGSDALRPFAILAAGAHVGNVVLEEIDRHVSSVRLHIYVGAAEARGRGVGRKALDLALDHAFGELDLNKVWLVAHALNAPALALYQRAGFHIEGELRDEFRLDGRLVAAMRLGILRREWEALRAVSSDER
jgi:RimJ/RimL family protein N-acetyltransferase